MKKQLLISGIAMLFGAALFAQLPDAITMSPAGATAETEITITVDLSKACSGDKDPVEGQCFFHSSAYDETQGTWPDGWGHVGVDFDATPGGDYSTELTQNDDGTFSMTFVPADFYNLADEGVDPANIIGIVGVFNGGSWDMEGKDFDEAGEECVDFYLAFADAVDVEGGSSNDDDDSGGDGSTSISINKTKQTLTVYPVPATEILTIESNISFNTANVYDLSGRLQKTVIEDYETQKEINIADLSSGVYILEIKGENQTLTQKFFKQ